MNRKYLIGIAVGAAIAGALATLLMKRRSGSDTEKPVDDGVDAGPEVRGRGTSAGFTVEEIIGDTSAGSDMPVGRTLNS